MIDIIEKGKENGRYFDAKLRGKLIGQFLLQANNKWQWRNSTNREQFYCGELLYIASALRKLDLISNGVIAGDQAKACECGSVNFALRDDYAIECNQCGRISDEWFAV